MTLKLNETWDLVYCHTCKRALFHLPITGKVSEFMDRVHRRLMAVHQLHHMVVYRETISRVAVRDYKVRMTGADQNGPIMVEVTA